MKIISSIRGTTTIPTLLFLLSFACQVKAQIPTLLFRHHTVQEGLSHNFVWETLQDSQGLIWIATIDGLNKFDGYKYTIYRTSSGDSSTLSSSNVASLAEDKNNNIWVGTIGGGVCVYNRKLDNFQRIPTVQTLQDSTGITDSFINCLLADSRERIWIGSQRNGLFLGDPDNFTFKNYAYDINNPAGLSHREVSSIDEDENGKIWIGTFGGGVNLLDPASGQFTYFKHLEGDSQSLSNDKVLSLFYDSKKRLWVGTTDNVLHLMENRSGKFKRFKHQPENSKSIGDYQIMDMEETDDQKIWISTINGLYVYNEDYRQFDHYTQKPFDPKSLSSNQLKSIDKDRQGRMWVSTYNGGVNLFDKSYIKILHYYNTPNKTSLSFNDVSAFLEDKDGSILVGTDAGGLNIFNKKTGHFTTFQHDPEDPNSIGGNLIKSLLMDRKGRIWIGIWAGGIDYFDREKQVFNHLKTEEYHNNWFQNVNVTSLTEDHNGTIWASTWGSGVVNFHPDQHTFKYFTYEENNPRSISERRAWAILCDHENNIWVGNANGILDLYDRENESFIHFNSKMPGGSAAVILTIFEDSKGKIWLGTEGGGLKLFDRESGNFKTYGTEEGLASNYISSIEEDSLGNFWLGTNNGLTHFNAETGKVENYGLRYGLQSLQFNRSSSVQLQSGEMMFGGVNGFNIFHPDSLVVAPQNVPIVLTDFQIFNRPVSIGNHDSPLSAHINEIKAITLTHDQSVFSIEYAGLYYPDPENIQYKYRLKGFVDENWQEVGHERKVTYTNLNPGKYLFEVSLVNGAEEGVLRSLPITVKPPWWLTLQARIMALLVLVGSMILFYRQRVGGIKRRNKKLEEEVAERTSRLKMVNDKLSGSQDKLKLAYDEVKLTTDVLNQIAVVIKGDSNDHITDVNEMFLQATGYNKEEVIGKASGKFLETLLSKKMHSPEFVNHMNTTLQQGKTWRNEVCYETKSGNSLWLLQNIIPLYDHHSAYAGFFSFSYDITSNKQQEEEIVKARRIAEEASATKESFLSVMSHEIRTPLNSVIGLSNLLLRKNPREDQMELVMTLKNAGDNLMYLINNILDYNKIKAGKIELEILPFNLKDQLQQLQFAHQPLALDKGLVLKISISSNTPDILVGDSLRLNQILNNLLNNALKFTIKGEVKLSVSVESADDKQCELQFVINDSGIGISEEKLKDIFTPFQQSEHNISREFGGTGLGLSIVKELVDLLSGSISFESKKDCGTTVTVTLPFKMSDTVLSLNEIQEPVVYESGTLEGYHILYVEDVESNQVLVKNLLADYDVDCIIAPNGDLALLHTSSKSFDVILMDLQMPGISGYETAKSIQNQKNGRNINTPIIAFTAELYSESLRNKIMECGMQELITKPFQVEQMIEKIKKVCPNRISEDDYLSFQFYEWTFKYNRKQLNEFKNLLIRDFKKFEQSFHDLQRKKELAALQSEIHKMIPIVDNLKCTPLIKLFEQYKKQKKYNAQTEKLNKELKDRLQDFFTSLQQLNY